ncbi:COG2363 [hydrothermal vent metagenome]|uniref:COG2363 n=1 Tax=hydrothermal vent metagenome TaxID=652676 RepID=A0A3B0X334_9ZZZZ
MTNLIIAFGAFNAFLAVGAGAFGAHGLKNMLTPEYLAVFKTAADYQLIHGVGLILIGVLSKDFANQYINTSAIFMSIGIILFSGSLYALTLSGTKWLGIITPIGGLCFLIAWLTLGLNFLINRT